jgi:hypothetical protein
MNHESERTICSYHDGRICHCGPGLGHVLRDIICTDCGTTTTITFIKDAGDLCYPCRIAARWGDDPDGLTRDAKLQLAIRAERKSRSIATLKDGTKWHLDKDGKPLPCGKVP